MPLVNIHLMQGKPADFRRRLGEIILSKDFLLAEDKKITDPTITRQLKR